MPKMQKNSYTPPTIDGRGYKSSSAKAGGRTKNPADDHYKQCGVDDYAAPFGGGRSTGGMKRGGRAMRSKSVGGASRRGSSGHGY